MLSLDGELILSRAYPRKEVGSSQTALVVFLENVIVFNG